MIKIYAMEGCPDCEFVKRQIEGDERFEYIDISKSVSSMKEFLNLRDNSPFFDKCKQKGLIGIPLFVLEDGTLTFKAAEVGLTSYRGNSCSIDNKGNC